MNWGIYNLFQVVPSIPLPGPSHRKPTIFEIHSDEGLGWTVHSKECLYNPDIQNGEIKIYM